MKVFNRSWRKGARRDRGRGGFYVVEFVEYFFGTFFSSFFARVVGYADIAIHFLYRVHAIFLYFMGEQLLLAFIKNFEAISGSVEIFFDFFPVVVYVF